MATSNSKSLNKSELITAIAEKNNSKKTDAESFLNAFLGVIEDTLSKKESITLMGFGSFLTRERAARKGKNPRTGEEINIPATVIPAFKPGKKLKDAVAPKVKATTKSTKTTTKKSKK